MKVSDAVMEMLKTRERTNILSTSDKSGRVNVAVFGSPEMDGPETLSMMLGDNRSHKNLTENPFGAFCVIRHGTQGMGIQGCRLYVKVRSMENAGPDFEARISALRARIGKGADILKHLVVFDILETRPILDFGQKI